MKNLEKSALGTIANNVSVLSSKPIKSRVDEVREFRNNNRKKIKELSTGVQKLLTGKLAVEFKRLKNCGKAIVAPSQQVSLLYNSEYQVAHYGGLATCGSVWACPECSVKIQLRRRAELGELIEKVYGEGYKIAMLTFTHPHQRDDSLKDVIKIFNSALRRFKQGRWYVKLFKENIDFGYVGDVTARELTWGQDNGWHWHAHRLVICKNPKMLIEMKEQLQNHWVHCYELACREFGHRFTELEKKYMLGRGLDIMEKAQSTDYLQKIGNGLWGAEKELTGNFAKTKNGKAGRFTPFELLGKRDDLFIEYIRATKGKRQLLYSDGLRSRFGLTKEKTDEELAQEQVEHSREIAKISYKNWQKILKENLKIEICEVLERDLGDTTNLKVWAKSKNLNISFFDSGG